MSTVTSDVIREGYEPIPGYRLEYQLGSGGFGEVWRCEAPGGLHKAIKFVFGSLDDKRAKRELKSLERIKGVHHPFLLTLERFEVIDGRLVIITELADGSLEDVYTRHRERGSAGIPRKALLSYLQDSADALDYLNASFQLQHLDVKPGNLLMVGGHVKVADFGLLKDLRDVECSLIGGLTPIYAAPEVFDGRPCTTSDQYSLAVMYQELLTGSRPFAGRTIAQLATQHVHSAPNLESLPPSDRPVVARALEKAPERRFASCLEFVEALKSAGDAVIRNHRDRFPLPVGSETQTGTFLGTSPMNGPAVEDLPKLSSDIQGTGPQGTTEHALVIGIGGTGAEILHHMRGRIASLHATTPIDMHSILIDSDAETIEGARLAESSGLVTPCTTIYTPLKSPKQYREAGTTHLSSISRRWLYNVPRSGMTEGLRPLGRLAMVDHGQTIKNQISEAIDHLAAVCGSSTPQVYVVASLSGGTGSGMVWDIAYLTRHLLDTQGLAQADIIPIVLVPDLSTVSRHPLGTADAHASIAELLHYLKPGNSYPGDEGAGWPMVPAARSPLSNCYIVAGPDTRQSGSPLLEMIAEYIWTDATKGGKVLRAARSITDESNPISFLHPTVRSLGAARLVAGHRVDIPRLTRAMTVGLLKSWIGRPVEAKQLAASMTEKLARRIGLDQKGLSKAVWEPLPADEQPLWNYLYELLSPLPVRSFNVEELEKQFVDAGFDLTEDEKSVQTYVETTTVNLRQELSLRLQDGRCDLSTACESLLLLIEAVTSLQEMHTLAGERRMQEAADAEVAMRSGVNRLHSSEVLGNPREPGPVMRWAELRLRAATDLRLALRTAFLIQDLKLLSEEFESCIKTFALASKSIQATNESNEDPWKSLPPEARGERGRAEDATRQAVGPIVLSFLQPGYHKTIDSEQLKATLIEAGGPVIESLVSGNGESAQGGYASTEFESIADALRAIRPILLICGGRQRLVLMVGSEAERQLLSEEVANAHGHPISVFVIPGMSPTLVHEAQGIPVSEMLCRLQVSLGGETRVLGRLHTRSDIRWNAS